MGCHGNYAFSHISPNRSIFSRTSFFRIKGIPGNNLASTKNCPWGGRSVELDTGAKLIGSYFIKYCSLFCI